MYSWPNHTTFNSGNRTILKQYKVDSYTSSLHLSRISCVDVQSTGTSEPSMEVLLEIRNGSDDGGALEDESPGPGGSRRQQQHWEEEEEKAGRHSKQDVQTFRIVERA